MNPVRLSVTFQQTASGFAARIVREDSGYGFNATYEGPKDAVRFAADTVRRELTEALKDQGGDAA